MTQVIVVSGVSGSGKSTVGRVLAARLSLPFQEGDDLHPPENIERMKAGRPLDDERRRGWLLAIGAWIDAHLEQGGVITCSALRRRYRDLLMHGRGDRVRFVFLLARADVLSNRLLLRTGHFMPPALLSGQLMALEMPDADERAILIHVDDLEVQEVVDRILGALVATPPGGGGSR